MLELFRPGAKDRQWTDLDNVIQRVLALLEPQMQKFGIQVDTKYISPGLLILAVTDQIQQVFLNLLLNSIEAMPSGGEIFIQTSRVREGLEIIIEDTGPGIPEVEHERIFEPFISSKENGTGLGLAVSYGVIQAHGGSLELMSGRGKGACFRIVLPTGGKV
jgi:two-component system sporulation sensor kinase A